MFATGNAVGNKGIEFKITRCLYCTQPHQSTQRCNEHQLMEDLTIACLHCRQTLSFDWPRISVIEHGPSVCLISSSTNIVPFYIFTVFISLHICFGFLCLFVVFFEALSHVAKTGLKFTMQRIMTSWSSSLYLPSTGFIGSYYHAYSEF